MLLSCEEAAARNSPKITAISTDATAWSPMEKEGRFHKWKSEYLQFGHSWHSPGPPRYDDREPMGRPDTIKEEIPVYLGYCNNSLNLIETNSNNSNSVPAPGFGSTFSVSKPIVVGCSTAWRFPTHHHHPPRPSGTLQPEIWKTTGPPKPFPKKPTS